MAQYLVPTFWFLCALASLAHGVFAFLSPVGWMKSWGRGRMRGLDNPTIVRIVGAAMTAMSVFWLIQGVHMMRGTLR